MNARVALITAMKAPHAHTLLHHSIAYVTQALQEMDFHVRILMNVLEIAKYVMAMLLVSTQWEATHASANSGSQDKVLQATALQVIPIKVFFLRY